MRGHDNPQPSRSFLFGGHPYMLPQNTALHRPSLLQENTATTFPWVPVLGRFISRGSGVSFRHLKRTTRDVTHEQIQNPAGAFYRPLRPPNTLHGCASHQPKSWHIDVPGLDRSSLPTSPRCFPPLRVIPARHQPLFINARLVDRKKNNPQFDA